MNPCRGGKWGQTNCMFWTFTLEMDTSFWLHIWRPGSPLVLLSMSMPFSKHAFKCSTSHYFQKTTKEGGEYFAHNKNKVIVASDEDIIPLFFFFTLTCLKFITDLERCARQAWKSYFGICLNKLEVINSNQKGECNKNQGCGKDLNNRKSMKGMRSVSLWMWVSKSPSYWSCTKVNSMVWST